MIYKGIYETFDENVECKSLLQLQEHIENAAGYEGNPNDYFREYETAWIYGYNILGRNTVSFYFSMKDKMWHKVNIPFDNYTSWREAKQPFKAIAEWLLSITGIAQQQREKIKAFTQKNKIAQLGR